MLKRYSIYCQNPIFMKERLTIIVSTISNNQMGLDATKSVIGVSEKARLKPVSSATETSKKVEFSLVASLDMVLP